MFAILSYVLLSKSDHFLGKLDKLGHANFEKTGILLFTHENLKVLLK